MALRWRALPLRQSWCLPPVFLLALFCQSQNLETFLHKLNRSDGRKPPASITRFMPLDVLSLPWMVSHNCIPVGDEPATHLSPTSLFGPPLHHQYVATWAAKLDLPAVLFVWLVDFTHTTFSLALSHHCNMPLFLSVFMCARSSVLPGETRNALAVHQAFKCSHTWPTLLGSDQ